MSRNAWQNDRFAHQRDSVRMTELGREAEAVALRKGRKLTNSRT